MITRHTTVTDGTAAPRSGANVVIQGERIKAIRPKGHVGEDGTVIDGHGGSDAVWTPWTTTAGAITGALLLDVDPLADVMHLTQMSHHVMTIRRS